MQGVQLFEMCLDTLLLYRVCCIASCMFLHILLCYLSVVSRVETSKILKNCISNTVSVDILVLNVTFNVIYL